MGISGYFLKPHECPCSYLPGRTSRLENLLVGELGNPDLEFLLESGFRHFGEYFFRPGCRGCHQCIPIRIPVNRFVRSRSVKRLYRKNRDMRVSLGKPVPGQDKYRLFKKHCLRFEIQNSDSYEEFVTSFFHPFAFNRMLTITLKGRLVAVSHLDMTPDAMSAVYCYFDEEYAGFSPGRYAVYREIDIAGQLGIKWLYLGYYVKDNPHMNYKTGFRPNQLLIGRRQWKDYMDSAGNIPEPGMLKTGFRPESGISPFDL